MMKINVDLKLYVQRRIFTYRIYQNKLPTPNMYPFGTIHKVESDFLGCKSGGLQLEGSVYLFSITLCTFETSGPKSAFYFYFGINK